MSEKNITRGDVFKAQNEKGVTFDEQVRAHVTWRQSPGKGASITLNLSYIDLTESRSSAKMPHMRKNAVAVSFCLPESAERTYNRITDEMVRKYGRNEHAERQAALRLLERTDFTVVAKDDFVINDPAFQKFLEESPQAKEALEKAVVTPVESIEDKKMAKLAETLVENFEWPIPSTQMNTTMHSDWRSYFEKRAPQSKGPGE